MSWLSKNHEKAVLGAAVVVALVLGYFGWAKFAGVEEDFPSDLKGAGNNNTAVADADLIPKALQSMKLDHSWTQAKAGERPVDLFTGIPLFVQKSAPEKPVDLLTAPPVHPPIPNVWWIEHRLDPGYADSPDRDPDGDGFSNKEEYIGKTDPNNSKSFPGLITKLKYVKDDSLAWVLRPGWPEGNKFSFTYEDSQRRKNKTPPGNLIEPNGLFFDSGLMAKRFKLLGHEVRKEVSKSTHVEVEVTIVRIEDQQANKKGDIYELPAPLQEERKNDFAQFDRHAVLSLEAIGEAGKEFKVEERTAFALPPSAAKKDYFLKKVTPSSISVEYTDPAGQRKTIEIPKGSLPAASE